MKEGNCSSKKKGYTWDILRLYRVNLENGTKLWFVVCTGRDGGFKDDKHSYGMGRMIRLTRNSGLRCRIIRNVKRTDHFTERKLSVIYI